MFKNNSIVCNICHRVLESPAKEPRLDEKILCINCQADEAFANTFIEEQKHLMEDLRDLEDND